MFEIKLSGTAEEALEQAEARGYATPYGADARKEVVQVGVEFDQGQRNISRWLVNDNSYCLLSGFAVQ